MKRSYTPGIAGTRRGFTLVELLTVIAIIAILAAILIVGVGKVMQKGKQTQALNQLRTLGTAIDLYRTENKNFYPFSRKNGAVGDEYWSEVIKHHLSGWQSVRITTYAGTPNVRATPDLLCPLLDSDRHNHLGDFGVNGALMVRENTSYALNSQGPSRISGSVVARPAQTVLIMTAEATDRTPPYGNWYVATHQYVTNPNAAQRPADRGTGFVFSRFVDGHVEAVPLADMQTKAARYLLPQ